MLTKSLLIGTLTVSAWSATAENCDSWFAAEAFDRIHVSAPVTVGIEQADVNEYCVHDQGDSALDVQVSDGVLYVGLASNAASNKAKVFIKSRAIKDVYVEAQATVTADSLKATQLVIESHGPSEIQLDNLNVDDLVVAGYGHANFRLSGAATHQAVDLDGISAYLAPNLASETTQVSVRGAGRVELWVEELLDVDILGAASVLYDGSPWVSEHILGQGAVTRL